MEYETERSKVKTKQTKTEQKMQRNYIWVNMWPQKKNMTKKKKKKRRRRYTASLARSEHFHQRNSSRRKEIPHHFTADACNDYFLSIAETLVKSQDLPDND